MLLIFYKDNKYRYFVKIIDKKMIFTEIGAAGPDHETENVLSSGCYCYSLAIMRQNATPTLIGQKFRKNPGKNI